MPENGSLREFRNAMGKSLNVGEVFLLFEEITPPLA